MSSIPGVMRFSDDASHQITRIGGTTQASRRKNDEIGPMRRKVALCRLAHKDRCRRSSRMEGGLHDCKPDSGAYTLAGEPVRDIDSTLSSNSNVEVRGL